MSLESRNYKFGVLWQIDNGRCTDILAQNPSQVASSLSDVFRSIPFGCVLCMFSAMLVREDPHLVVFFWVNKCLFSAKEGDRDRESQRTPTVFLYLCSINDCWEALEFSFKIEKKFIIQSHWIIWLLLDDYGLYWPHFFFQWSWAHSSL